MCLTLTRQNPTPEVTETVRPYSALATLYDAVMSHVDYASWALYAADLIEQFHPDLHSILEIGCGTGSLSMLLAPKLGVRYLASDISEEMLDVARGKAMDTGTDVHFFQSDFRRLHIPSPVGAVLCLHDGFNYLLEDGEVRDLLDSVWYALEPGGIFLFDQSTPANSIKNKEFFDDEGSFENNQYIRRSRYIRRHRRHITEFELRIDGVRYLERHVQRARGVSEVRALLSKSPFEITACYDGMTLEPAVKSSERVHWVLTKKAHFEHDRS
jgi:SAM-dependent methyltransferase